MVTSQRPRTGERHVTPLESTRRGAHRARPGALAAALPLLAVAVVVVIAVFAMFQIFDSNGSGGDGQTVAENTPQSSQGPQPSVQPSAQQPETSPSQSEGPAAPQVDTKAPLTVLNNTATAGLGRRAANKLKAADWTVKTISNLKPLNQVTTTTVFYLSDDQEATARAIVEALGVGDVSQSQSQAKNGITVVLAADFS
jgi:hypothetical protein